MNSKITLIRKQLWQIYEGGNWLEESFSKKLDHLPVALAFVRPAPNIHSVAELVWHCTYWRRVNLQRLAGNAAYRDATVETENFLPLEVLQRTGWEVLKSYLDSTQDLLLEELSDKDDLYLLREYESGKSYEFILAGTIEHDAYHLGQIGLVIRMLKEAGHFGSLSTTSVL